MEEIKIRTEYIRLDDMLKFAGACESGGHAKVIVQSGEVEVDGETCTMRGKKLRPGNTVKYDGKEYKIV